MKSNIDGDIILFMKRVTLFMGHYGSGKTNLSVNYAISLARQGQKVTIADLDIVNPYFKTGEFRDELEAEGIRLIANPSSNADMPALSSELYSLVQDLSRAAIFDVGGDDRGAYALGRFTPSILEEDNYEALMVVNFCRPLTTTPEAAIGIMQEIEAASRIPFTGIAANTNLGAETDMDVIRTGLEKTERLSELTGLPIRFVSVERQFEEETQQMVDGKYPVFIVDINKSIG